MTTRIYTRRLCKGLMDSPRYIDERVRFAMLDASDVVHVCAKCKQKFQPKKSGTRREVMGLSINRDGVFRFAGYLCPTCSTFHTKLDCNCEQCKKKCVQQSLEIDVPRERKTKRGLNETR